MCPFLGISNALQKGVVNLKTMKSIIAGVILIGIGFATGDSVFLGDFGVLSLFWDGLGLFWIGKGAYTLWSQRQSSQGEA